MFALLAKLLGGPVVNGLINAYKLKLDASQNSERISADLAGKEIEADIAARSAAKELLISEQGWWVTAMIRPLFALPFVLYNFKLIVYDKMLGWGSTDPLSDELFQIEIAIIGFYFFGRTVEKTARILKR